MGTSHSYRYVSVSVSSSYNGTIAVGTKTSSTSSTTSVSLGWKPRYLSLFYVAASGSTRQNSTYDERISTTQYFYGTNQSGYSGGWGTLGSNAVHRLYSIDSNGFTIAKDNIAATYYYFAIK